VRVAAQDEPDPRVAREHVEHLVAALRRVDLVADRRGLRDNTTPRPDPEITEPCLPLSKVGCGTFPLGKRSGARVYGGHRPSRISVHTSTGFAPASGECLIGDATTFDATGALVGGNREGSVLEKMPKASAFRRHGVRLTASTHKRSSWGDPEIGTSTNEITRKVTVTFKRL
jgi:hypothetical protein